MKDAVCASYCGCIEDRQRRLGHIRWQLAETVSAYSANAVIGSMTIGSLFLRSQPAGLPAGTDGEAELRDHPLCFVRSSRVGFGSYARR
jgi:hypothetical protein